MSQEQEQAPQENNGRKSGEPVGRRDFIKNLVGAGAATLLIPSFLQSCKKEITQYDPYVPTDRISIGEMGVYYGQPGNLTGAGLEAAKKLDTVIVQPGNIRPSEATALGIKAQGYMSAVSIVPASRSTGLNPNIPNSDPAKDILNIEAKFDQLDAAAIAANTPAIQTNPSGPFRAYLYGTDGHKLVNPATGNGFLLDVRNPDVANALLAYGKEISKYPRGNVVDELDVAVAVGRGQYAGNPGYLGAAEYPNYAERTAVLVNQIAVVSKQANGNSNTDIFSGIQPDPDGALLTYVAKAAANSGCAMTLESRVYNKSGDKTSAAYEQQVIDLIVQNYAGQQHANGRKEITFNLLEPVDTLRSGEVDGVSIGQYERAAVKTAEFAKRLTAAIKSAYPEMHVHANIAINGVNRPDGYFNHVNTPNDFIKGFELKNSAQLKALDVVKNDVKGVRGIQPSNDYKEMLAQNEGNKLSGGIV